MRKQLLISPVSLSLFDDSGIDDKYLSEVEKLLQEKNIPYSSVNKVSNTISIKLSNSREVLVSQQKDMNTEISSLQYILSHLTMEGKDFTRLDLRFDKPVIVLR